MEWRGPAATETIAPAPAFPGASGESAAIHAGAEMTRGASAPTPHWPASFRPKAQSSPPAVTHKVWWCPADTDTIGSWSGRPSTGVRMGTKGRGGGNGRAARGR